MLVVQVSMLIDNIKHGFKLLIPIIILLVYTLIGALIFMAVEAPNENYELRRLQHERKQLLEDTVFRLNRIKSMNPIQAYNHTVNTLTRYSVMLGVSEVELNKTKWNIWGAIYFSMTVYTTIGYGNIVPATTTGRIITLIYAFIGIPLTLITLIALGTLFASICMKVWKLMTRSMGCISKDLQRKMTHITPGDEVISNTGSEDDAEELLHFPVGFLIGVTIFWIFFCAYVFLLWEDTWTYGLSLYFVLISFTTIGFGDVIPSKSNYMILVGLMLLIGLSLVSTVLTIIQKQIHAVADDMKDKIDKDYQAALEKANEGEDALFFRSQNISHDVENKEDALDSPNKSKKLAKSEEEKKNLKEVISKMPIRSRILYYIMPSDRRKQLAKHVARRQHTGVKWVQTDDYLMKINIPKLENSHY